MKRWRYDSAFFRARPSLGSAIESLLADVIQHGGGQHLGAGLAALKALADDRRGNIEPRRLSQVDHAGRAVMQRLHVVG